MSSPLPRRPGRDGSIAGPLRRPPQGPCGRCRSTVMWVPTMASNGQRVMPVDIDVTVDGLCFLMPAANGRAELWVRVIGHHAPIPPDLVDEPRYTSHMWSCPGIDDRWNRSKRR